MNHDHKMPVELGFPSNDLSGYRLLYNPASSVIAAHVWIRRDGYDWGRVFIRRHDEQQYRLAGAPPDDCTDVALITCDGPFLFFLRRKGKKRERVITVGQESERQETWGFDTEGVVRLHLHTETNDLLRVGPRGKRWIADLQCASADGDVLYGNVAITDNAGRVRNSIARIVWSLEEVEEIAKLPAVFV